jgi:predicted nucleotidyltransferase component of viral defense system
MEAIAAMKVNVLFLRATYRDYYDLYFLAKELGVRKIFDLSKDVVPGLTYKLFCTALLYIDDIADDNISHLKPKENMSKKEIQSFLEKGIF